MSTPRVLRLDALIARASRPGGVYPPMILGARDVGPEERAAMRDRLDRSPLAQVWRVWRDPAATPVARALALAAFEPSCAHVHLLAADLSLRDEDAHAEPHPELRAALRARDPRLWAAYARLLEDLWKDFDSDREVSALRRGFGYSAERAQALFTVPSERECFARACIAWGGGAWSAIDVLSRAEAVEHALRHDADGASAQLSPDDFAALECPELLTALALNCRDAGPALRTLDRAPNLRALTLETARLTGDADEGRALAALPLASLTLSVQSSNAVLVPAWIATLPSLRALTLRYPKGSTDAGAVDLPMSLCDLGALTTLRLSGVRSLPDALGRLTNLRALELRGWDFTGLPPSIVEMARLEALRVDPTLRLPGLPAGFERLRALREVRLGHLATTEVPEALLRMPWLRRVELISGRRWPASHEEALRRALPDAYVFVAFTGNAY